MNIRTALGSVYFSRSVDEGAHWEPTYTSAIPAPASPSTMSLIPDSGELIIFHNPIPGSRIAGHKNFQMTSLVFRKMSANWLKS